MRTKSFSEVIEAIQAERSKQDAKWGSLDNQDRPLSHYLLTARHELINEAFIGWQKNLPGKDSCLYELVQVAAVVIAALEEHGLEGNGI